MSDEPPVSTSSGPLRASGKVFRRGENGPVCFVKAVTFGPFPPGVFPGGEIRTELERVKDELGANAVRFYEPPPIHWLNDCADLELMAFISISWSQHVDFLNQKNIRRETELRIKDITNRYRGNRAVAGYFVGNEIETTLVRYLGPKKVVRFLEHLIDTGRSVDPGKLFSYANYPSTEFLIPGNQDFLAFNVYLEQPENFGSYLDRLQSLSGNLPVLISEFGVDSRDHGTKEQAEILNWHIDEICRAGIAGTTIFSWSDQWSRGGETIMDWDFGLTDRNGIPKEALHTLARKWEDIEKPFDGVTLDETPKFSIIICTYKGARLIEAALESLRHLDYPDFEVIVVNDGNDQSVRELVQSLDHVRHVGVPHGGLSNARNIGAKTSTGDIIVYTDDDCFVDPDWLNWLALAFSAPDRPDCVGGPNIPPPALNSEQAFVIASPGGPSHVLIGDRSAEHVPGCNIAVKKEVFDAIGGFDAQFWTAGDDVDFCWRLIDAGYKIGFHGAAYVWHLRRSTYQAYIRQQRGYGKAEAMLMRIHPDKFGNIGGAAWRGFVYDGPALSFSRSSEEIHHGKYGYEPFQLIYPDHKNGISSVFSHAGFVIPFLLLIPFGFLTWWAWVIAGAGLSLTLTSALKSAFRADLQREFDSLWARLVIARLTILQGFMRSAERMFRAFPLQSPVNFAKGVWSAITHIEGPRPGSSMVVKFWSEDGKAREALLDSLDRHFKLAADTSGDTDFRLKSGLFFQSDLVTVTEYHEKNHLLTRAKISSTLKIRTFLIGLAAVLLIGDLLENPLWLPVGFLGVVMLEWIFHSIRNSWIVGSAGIQAGLDLFKD
ncbi:MAG: glycosyltransferase [Verrucomicrobiales bacterium]|nr:glycosyltransferase [Verrucomicrobiales bacterium]